MSDKLFVHNDAPAELKENIRLSQKILDNTTVYRQKAKDGTLTIDDLKNLSRQNDQVIAQFPKGDRTKVGLPAKLDSREDIKALANMRLAETQAKAGSHTGLKINSLQELQTICQMPPESIATKVLDDAKRKKAERKAKQSKEKPDERKSTPKGKKIKPGVSGDALFLHNHLKEIASCLSNCKFIYYDLTADWTKVVQLEKMFNVQIEGLEEHGEKAVNLLTAYVTEEVDDDEIEEKQPAAAFALASIHAGDHRQIDNLVIQLRDEKSKEPLISQALKYGLNPIIEKNLETRLSTEPPHAQAAIIDILAYRKAINLEKWEILLKNVTPPVQSKILKAFTQTGQKLPYSALTPLLENPEESYFEETLFTGMKAGFTEALYLLRKQFINKSEHIVNQPLYLACAGVAGDFQFIQLKLSDENARLSAIKALGILGLIQGIPLLMKQLKTEDLPTQKVIVDSLKLITGAQLELPFPEIKEGPEGKEHEVTLESGWAETWQKWWIDHQNEFNPGIRYRRGRSFTLESCINEMAYPRGNHWSRQYAYHELQIRSGQHITQFEADWWVNDQFESIEKWQQWWEENKTQFEADQWLFYGKTNR